MTLLDLQAAEFRAHFGRRPFLVRHRLTDHPLLSLPRLVELAQRLPSAQVEYNAGDLPIGQDPACTPRNGLSAQETVRRIEECRSWLVLKDVQQVAEYAELLERCLAEVRPQSAALVPGMSERQAYIFVSSPDAVTPYHLDPEENFLLQIRGRKTIHVGDPADRSLLSEQALERFFTGAHRNLAFHEEYRAKVRAFELTPGTGVHVPLAAPHWVLNGPEVSVSFSITFQTRASLRRKHAHRVNARLRSWGLQPLPVGQSALRDSLKQLAFRINARINARISARAA
jgi:ribosomal protein L16 Arg81 hydroxylase